ncbi:MAG: NTP transferase domain-containing protein [Proteobacteria bacterium]|nr:NTP transferase domain-containing protein [Pseudomonadota bacterium]
MHAVIIAAGLGNRLGRLTKDRPKALVPVAGRELILRTLDAVDHPVFTRRTVVTGYQGDMLRRFIENTCDDVEVVHNPNFEDGSIRTVETVLPLIDGDFLLLNVDHIYPRRLISHVVAGVNELTAVCDFDRKLGPDDMKVKLDETGRVIAIKKTLTDYTGGYIGMTHVPSASLPPYKRAVFAARARQGDAAAAEAALASLAEAEFPINVCDASGIGWLEVDTPVDLAHAEAVLNDNQEFLR